MIRTLNTILLLSVILFASQVSFAGTPVTNFKHAGADTEKEDKEIDDALDSMPVTDEHIGDQIQEKITDEKLTGEDA